MTLDRKCLLLFALSLMLAGCAGAPPKRTGLMEKLDIDASRRELQITMYGYGEYASGQIEMAADRIFEESDDPQVRQMAILWKLNAIPEVLKASFANDPSAAMINSWLFAVQMRNYFESGNGNAVFGPQQPIAVESSRQLVDGILTTLHARRDSVDVARVAAKIDQWAEQYPIRNQLFVRENYDPALSKAIAGDVSGGLSAAGAMNETMLAMTDRANVMTAQVPRMVQWQSQLLMAQSESMVATHLDSAFSLSQPFLHYLTSERRAVTEDVAKEREAILNGIAEERLAVLEGLAAERTEVLRSIANERNITLEEIHQLTLTAIQQIVDRSESVAEASIDRVFRRTLQLLALPFMVLLVLAIAALMLLRAAIQRMPPPPSNRQ